MCLSQPRYGDWEQWLDFVAYLRVISAARTVQLWTVRLWANNVLEEVRKKAVVSWHEVLSRHLNGGAQENLESLLSQYIRYAGPDLNTEHWKISAIPFSKIVPVSVSPRFVNWLLSNQWSFVHWTGYTTYEDNSEMPWKLITLLQGKPTAILNYELCGRKNIGRPRKKMKRSAKHKSE
jgi:hypothetical protein